MASLPLPTVGEVVDGYRFLGGNPANRSSWEKVALPPPKIGDVVDGYRFKGGTPSDRASWEIVGREPTYLPEKPESESVFRQVADVPLSIAKGATQGVRMIADAFGAGSETSKTIKGAEDYIAGLMSAQSKNDSKEVARIMKEIGRAHV